MVKKPVRVRIAPSPTGPLHVGIARTALFNWLFVRKHDGAFLIRIEDTDRERSSPEYEQDILENLTWLGLNWDEKPYKQSERGEIYKKYIKQLLDKKLAYYCFCTKEELETERQGMLSQGLPPKYTGKCRNLTEDEVNQKLNSHQSYVIRFKMPDAEISFSDIIRGKITFDMGLVGDISIAKDKQSPLYNLAVVIDDYEMEISHVIRGEDHLTNTPKQISLQRALGFSPVKYAHLPLILSSDRAKLSKRAEAAPVSEFRKQGYLPEAMVNFLALIGWHPEAETDPETGKIQEQELLLPDELIEKFTLERVQKGGASFNPEKLDWLNSQYIKKLDNEKLLAKIKDASRLPEGLSQTKLVKILEIVKDRMRKLTDFNELADFFFGIADYPKEMLTWKETPEVETLENLKNLSELLEKLDSKDFTREKLTGAVDPIALKQGRGETFWPLRVALTGKEASPGPIEIMEVIGKRETIKRLAIAVQKLETGEQQII